MVSILGKKNYVKKNGLAAACFFTSAELQMRNKVLENYQLSKNR